jgi:hypothetical protein
MDNKVTDFLILAESLVDEEIKENNSTLLVHHVNGNKNNKLVVGTSMKGKTKSEKSFNVYFYLGWVYLIVGGTGAFFNLYFTTSPMYVIFNLLGAASGIYLLANKND